MEKGTKQIPEPALRLLKLYLSGDASAVLGDEWKGYRFTNGLILYLSGEMGSHRMRSELFLEVPIGIELAD